MSETLWMASNLAKLFKEVAPSLFGPKARVMTDAVGAFAGLAP